MLQAVDPYARRLSLRTAGLPQPQRCGPEALGGRAGRQPLPVGLVAVTHCRPGARWRPRSLSLGQGVLALLAHTVPARRRPAAALAALQQVARQAPALKGRPG